MSKLRPNCIEIRVAGPTPEAVRAIRDSLPVIAGVSVRWDRRIKLGERDEWLTYGYIAVKVADQTVASSRKERS